MNSEEGHLRNFEIHGENLANNVKFINDWILTASLGSFGLSFAFVSSLNGSLKDIYLLYIAWICFIIDVVLMVYMYYISYRIDNKTQSKINELTEKNNSWNYHSKLYDIYNTEGPFKGVSWKKFMLHISRFVSATFCLALISALSFALLNIKNITEKKQDLSPTIINNYYYNK